MAEKVTDYTPKSQNFIDTDLFDVSKHVTQTSGALVIGKRYTILDFNTGDNFTNVANVISGTINTTGCVFDAIGTTPTTYSNGSTLALYETQSYTWAELKAGLGVGAKVYKALLTQTGTSAPVATVLVNTLSGTPVWSRDDVGNYYMTLAGEFLSGKIYASGLFLEPNGNIVAIPVLGAAGGGLLEIKGYYQIQRNDDDTIFLYTYDDSGISPIEFNTLFSTGKLSFPTIEVYP